MKALIVVAHPGHDSFTQALAQHFARGVESSGHEVETASLYEEGFNPVVSLQELQDWKEGRISPEIRAWQERIRSSQGLILAFPVWWGTPPAILSGWLQRVLTQGFAFRQANGRTEGLLKLRAQLLINVGSRQRTDVDLAAHYLDPMLGVLNYCGMDVLPTQANWGVYTGASADLLRAYLETARTNGQQFFPLNASPASLASTHQT